METSVKLQEPFSYSILPIVIVGIIVAGLLIFFVVAMIMKMSGNKSRMPVVYNRTAEVVAEIKTRYINELCKIEADYGNKTISARSAYQKMSRCIRKFVYEMTGIRVHNYTLQDIRGLNMPVLEELIREYYEPEFSKQPSGDVISSLEKTKRAIERWS